MGVSLVPAMLLRAERPVGVVEFPQRLSHQNDINIKMPSEWKIILCRVIVTQTNILVLTYCDSKEEKEEEENNDGEKGFMTTQTKYRRLRCHWLLLDDVFEYCIQMVCPPLSTTTRRDNETKVNTNDDNNNSYSSTSKVNHKFMDGLLKGKHPAPTTYKETNSAHDMYRCYCEIFVVKPLHQSSITDATVHCINGWDYVRGLSGKIMELMPSPLPGYDKQMNRMELVQQCMFLVCSPRLVESDGGAMLLNVLFDKFVRNLYISFNLQNILQGQSFRTFAEEKDCKTKDFETRSHIFKHTYTYIYSADLNLLMSEEITIDKCICLCCDDSTFFFRMMDNFFSSKEKSLLNKK
ncbi:hypothetical protein RFI_35529 [Reticulomyxa filosa]|uniref:Uncharacterized protein n=1 Tax=Reticulomyxa filosa TaxID=46433 RepID=X6LMI6_RETFI|nr:hypothetical protein RFI_35529 [Reticulomyxa filosa]|eukprot:ETO01910.1 hypothetical protein RFI_35529 [Reticulomyxa filosa]